jgi:hypothetical protein
MTLLEPGQSQLTIFRPRGRFDARKPHGGASGLLVPRDRPSSWAGDMLIPRAPNDDVREQRRLALFDSTASTRAVFRQSQCKGTAQPRRLGNAAPPETMEPHSHGTSHTFSYSRHATAGGSALCTSRGTERKPRTGWESHEIWQHAPTSAGT